MDGRFKKGQTPFNKGKKWSEYLSAESIETLKKTRFQKGNVNWKNTFDGNISLRNNKGVKCYFIRISKGIWVPLHRHIWEEKNGTVPIGHFVSFKDKNTLNYDYENLELISRKNGMLKNSITNYPTELRELITLQTKITKKIKSYGKG